MSAAQRFTRRLLAFVLVSALPGTAATFENGPLPANTGGFGETDCSACHFDNTVNAGNGNLTIEGVPEVFEQGRRYALTIVLSHPDLVGGGFQVSVRNTDGGPAGELASADNDVSATTLTTTGVTYLQHNRPRANASGAVRWNVTWKAPEAGDNAIVSVAANATNGDASPLGDYVYLADAKSTSAETQAASSERAEPTFWRETRYNLRWAGAASNLSYITRYIAEGMLEELGRDTGYIAYGTRGNSTSVNIYAVGDYEVDFGLTTPPLMAKLAHDGNAYFDKAYTDLRAIAVLPQDDWIMCVADAELGITSFADIRERRLGVRIATNRIGRDNGVSFLVEQLFRAHGISPEDIERWGGSFIEVLGAPGAAGKVRDSEADIGCHEYWKAFYRLTDVKPVTILPVTDAAMGTLADRFGYRPNFVRKDLFGPGNPANDVQVVDYSDWLVMVNANVPDDIAYVAAKIAVEEKERGYERLYLGQTDRQRSADVPVDPKTMWNNVGVALHPGAERYYREAGLMDNEE